MADGQAAQSKLREPARGLREPPAAAVRASPMKAWLHALWRASMLGVGGGVFLALIAAFGSDRLPLAPRVALFVGFGLVSGLVAATVVTAAMMIPFLAARTALRYAVVSLVMTSVLALAAWAIIGGVILGRPHLAILPYFVAPVFVTTVFMSLISWGVFRTRRAEAPAQPSPVRFLERLPVRLRGAEIYAVEAEDHYLRLHTSKGQDLILMRLSDAIAELEGIEGAQTHRSWWVAKDALADAKRGDGRAVLKLKNGAEAPVSRTYARALREAGWY